MEKYYEKSRTTDWSYKHILEDLDLKETDLEGKRILDIGSGGASFALEKRTPLIVSLDPKYGSGSFNSVIVKAEKDLKEAGLPHVAALAEQLPFTENTFDLVVSHYGSPMYQTDLNQPDVAKRLVKESIKEMVRVLKEDGQIRLHSVLDTDHTPDKQWIDEALSEIGGHDFDIKHKGELMIIDKKMKDVNNSLSR